MITNIDGRQFLFHISQNNTAVLRVPKIRGMYILQKRETTLIKENTTEHAHTTDTSKVRRKKPLIKQTNRPEMLSSIVLYWQIMPSTM